MLTWLAEQHSQVLSVEGADVQEESRTLAGPEPQGHVFCFEGYIGVGGGRDGAAVAPVQLVHLLAEGVAD